MRRLLLASCFGVAAMFTAGYAVANDDLMKMSADPNQWVMPAGNFANTRFSELKQINTENVHKLAPPGLSPPACCADMKARRWSSAT